MFPSSPPWIVTLPLGHCVLSPQSWTWWGGLGVTSLGWAVTLSLQYITVYVCIYIYRIDNKYITVKGTNENTTPSLHLFSFCLLSTQTHFELNCFQKKTPTRGYLWAQPLPKSKHSPSLQAEHLLSCCFGRDSPVNSVCGWNLPSRVQMRQGEVHPQTLSLLMLP